MRANTKLQGEINRVLKEVRQGIGVFNSIWKKANVNQTEKEKFEADLENEIEKLLSYKEQMKTWIESTEIKDKKDLMNSQKLIEHKMEQYKIYRKETEGSKELNNVDELYSSLPLEKVEVTKGPLNLVKIDARPLSMDEQFVVYSSIKKDKVILCEYGEAPEQFMSLIFPTTHMFSCKFRRSGDQNDYYFLADNEMAYSVVAKASAGPHLPMDFLELVVRDFSTTYGGKCRKFVADAYNIQFG